MASSPPATTAPQLSSSPWSHASPRHTRRRMGWTIKRSSSTAYIGSTLPPCLHHSTQKGHMAGDQRQKDILKISNSIQFNSSSLQILGASAGSPIPVVQVSLKFPATRTTQVLQPESGSRSHNEKRPPAHLHRRNEAFEGTLMLDPASKRYRKTPDLRPEARGGAGHPYRRRNADHQVVPRQAGKIQILVLK